MSRQGCSCSGERWPDGSHVVTVACPVHHLMSDGAPAADHEILCMCGNFADGRACVEFNNTEDEEGQFYVCPECVRWADKQPHLSREAA